MEAQEVNICPKEEEIVPLTPRLKSVFSRLTSKIN